MSFIVNSLSAMIAMPGLSSMTSRKPLNLVNSTSEMEPMKTGDIKHIAPLGVQANKNLIVLWCL